MAAESLRSALAKNRTEELGHDVWTRFVVPPFYDRLDLGEARKARLIVGGRGCGKTMLLRYLSHHSTFSGHRSHIPDTTLAHIGLYWRADTQFTSLMTRRGFEDDVWQVAFDHFLALVIGLQILDSLRSIAASACRALTTPDLASVTFSGLSTYLGMPDRDLSLDMVADTLSRRLDEFELWVSNLRRVPQPQFLPGYRFLIRMIDDVKRQIQTFADAQFYVYIDEYENLQPLQQRIINTHIKHSEVPLIFNVAVKRHGIATRATLGAESISDIADFRTHDIEQYLDDDFEVFAAEVLISNLSLAGMNISDLDTADLRDPSKVSTRRGNRHQASVLAAAKALLPSPTEDEVAKAVLADQSLRGKLEARVQHALSARNSDMPVSAFVRSDFPSASITCMALLNRSAVPVVDVHTELLKLSRGEENRFTGPTNWIHNNLFACILSLYSPFSRPCPLYAGFETFCALARGNLRHFLELCHQSLRQARTPTRTKDGGFAETSPLQIGATDQAQAARQASADFLGEVKSFGNQGRRLHSFVLGIGSLFALAHSRPTQSEPEQAHFSIVGGDSRPDDETFITEALKWSVLFETKETKVKDHSSPASVDYVLNPIYAPYFHISYRKRRKLELKAADFSTLMSGKYEDLRLLLKRYESQWKVDSSDSNPSLFTHLESVL